MTIKGFSPLLPRTKSFHLYCHIQRIITIITTIKGSFIPGATLAKEPTARTSYHCYFHLWCDWLFLWFLLIISIFLLPLSLDYIHIPYLQPSWADQREGERLCLSGLEGWREEYFFKIYFFKYIFICLVVLSPSLMPREWSIRESKNLVEASSRPFVIVIQSLILPSSARDHTTCLILTSG